MFSLFMLQAKILDWIVPVATEPPVTTTEITNRIEKMLNDLISSVRIIATPLAIIGLIFCVIRIFTSPDEKTVHSSKQGVIWILIAVAVIWLAEPIITAVQSIAG